MWVCTTPSPLSLELLMRYHACHFVLVVERDAETRDAGIDACRCSPLLLVQTGPSGALRVLVALGLSVSQWAGRGQTFGSSSFSTANALYPAVGTRA